MNSVMSPTLWMRPQADTVEQFAARELQRYLAQMLTRKMASRPHPRPEPIPTLYLAISPGEPPAAEPGLVDELPQDGYALRGSRDGVLLQAPTPRGLLYAAYGLLKHLGARWFFPGPEGEFTPRLDTLALEGLRVTSAPVVSQRGVLIRGTSPILDQWVDFAPKIGLNAFALETHHGIHQLPGLAAGRGLHLRLRRVFFPTVFCSQDERTLRWEETLVKGYLQSLPAGIDSVHVRPADAFLGRCECAVDAPYNLADQVMRFSNRMAPLVREVRAGEEFPYVAYLSTWCPPPRVEPEAGVTLSLAPIHRCFNHTVDDPTCSINASYRYDRPLSEQLEYGVRPIVEEYMRRADPATTFVVDYWVDASFFGRYHMSRWECRLPGIGARMQRDIQYYSGLGIPSIWTFVVFIDDGYLRRFTSPLIFQYGELLWNPKADLAAGLRDFCGTYYGDETLAGLFGLEEPVDPRDCTRDMWIGEISRASEVLSMTREATAGTTDDAIRGRLTRLVGEQEHRIAAMRRYLQEAPEGSERHRDQPPA